MDDRPRTIVNVHCLSLKGIHGFAKKLFSGLSAKRLRCGEIIEGRVDLDNDLSVEYESNRDVYYARKVLIENNKCFQRMEVGLKFTSTRELLKRYVTSGEFVENGQVNY